ncbi:hypothetical protein C4B68_07810 [Streptomyces dengpaensis]|uniref:Uncharacterized protein n=1 Tax=Streptomyces dengpaensis TaxID=2049881 RepID=A0ABN5HYS6_9ACTN|nr:hypothetical protein C4B68_07810 [Streptomyces dengpaensis]
MQHLLLPLPADQAGEFGRSGAGGGEAGDAQHRDRADRLALQVVDVALAQEDLLDVWERQIGWCWA